MKAKQSVFFYKPLLTRLAYIASMYGVVCTSAWSIDLLQSYEAAVHNDYTIRAARAQADASREQLPQAQAQLRPTVSLNINRNRNNLESITGSNARQTTLENDYYSSSKNLVIRQPLYRPALTAALEQAKALVQDADAVLENNEQNLVMRVGEAYFNLLLADDQVALLEAQKNSYNAQLQAAIQGFKAGSGAKTDIDEAQARLDLTVAQELESKQNRDVARRRFEVITGESAAKLAGLNSHIFRAEAPIPSDVDEWILLAEQSSPELQALRAQVEVAEVEISKAQAAHKPTLDLVAQWSKTNSDSVTSVNSRYDQKALGLQLAIPLYSGGYVSAVQRQAIASYAQAQERMNAARLDLAVRVHEQFQTLQGGMLKIGALEQAVRSAEQAVISNQKSFKAGTRTTLDVLNAEQQKTAAQRDLAQQRYAYLLAKLQLHALAGMDRTQNIKQINDLLIP